MARGEYQLWDMTTGNCAGAYDDEATALAEVRAGVQEDGPDSFEGIALVRSLGRTGEVEDLGQGRVLVARALAAPKLPAPIDNEPIADNAADQMTEKVIDIAGTVPHLDIRGRADVRITADGRRVIVEFDTESTDSVADPASEIRRRA
ncbi:MAG: hypothetical protein U0841_05045 [Chloroflexia bacterium]